MITKFHSNWSDGFVKIKGKLTTIPLSLHCKSDWQRGSCADPEILTSQIYSEPCHDASNTCQEGLWYFGLLKIKIHSISLNRFGSVHTRTGTEIKQILFKTSSVQPEIECEQYTYHWNCPMWTSITVYRPTSWFNFIFHTVCLCSKRLLLIMRVYCLLQIPPGKWQCADSLV